MKLLYKLTSRSRPAKFFNTIENIISMAAHDNYAILCSLDLDDSSMNNQDVKNKIQSYGEKVIPIYALSTGKINAINRDMEHAETLNWDILINMSDDMMFTEHGFDLHIINAFANQAPDLNAFLHIPDRDAKQALCTLSIMGKKYYHRFNYIYHPSYLSLWADNEAMQVAQRLGKYIYLDRYMLEHYHPAYGKESWDDQYMRQQNLWNIDEANYKRRESLNFELSI